MGALLPDRSRVDALLDGALDRRDWRAWLAAACDDAAVRAEVERLMAAHERAGGVLDAPIADALGGDALGADALGTGIPDTPPDAVGPYRVVRELGRGGMGAVYLAERDDGQFARTVAVKVLRRGLDADDLVRRFVMERQILATLRHPHIAALLDGGVAADGRPYIVMEYVDGEPIDRYCEARDLPVAARVALARDVARALHAAHQALVVHRDLKPSNILVTGDAPATVKLVDFGIAKLLDPDALDATVPLTRTGLRPMTPEFASPEQVRGDRVTTATDVYGLGLVLYELLTGERAQRPRDRTLREIERAVCETEPPRPSAVARTPKLARALRGDLDRIVACALQKRPERRYASAEQMAEDLDRHLTGRPVTARGDSLAYRAGKLVARHRWTAAATAALALSLVGYAITITVQARRVERALDQALVQAEKAEQVTAFALGLFDVPDPAAGAADAPPAPVARAQVTVHELLARAATRAEQLGARPAVQAQMLDVVGLAHQRLGDYAAAQPYLERALALRRRAFGARHESTAESMYHVAALHGARGAYVAAESLYRAALDVQQSLLGAGHPQTARTLDGLGLLLQDRGDYPGAERLTRAALAARRSRGDDHPDVATSLTHLAFQLQLQGRLDAAEPIAREALATRRRLLGDDHPDVAAALSALGLLHWQRGDFASADTLQTRALAIRRRVLGAEHPAVGQSLGILGALRRTQGRLAEAESVYHEALAVQRRALGPEHPELAHTMNGLALTVRDAGRLAEADSIQQAVLALRRRVLGPGHPAVAMSLHQLGMLRKSRGHIAESRALLRNALAIRRAALGEDHPLTRETERELKAIP